MAFAKLDFVDALRGYAILGVLIVHVSQYCNLGSELAFGARGVQLFFVVSAFTLTASWNIRNDGAAAFLVRRFFRIAPMWWVAMVLMAPTHSQHAAPFDVLLNALLLHGLYPSAIEASVGGGWSVGVEVLFYILFPFIAATVRGATASVIFFVCSYLASDYWMSNRGAFVSDPYGFFALPSQLSSFAAGIAAYWLSKLVGQSARTGSVLIMLGILLAARQTFVNVHALPIYSVAFLLIMLGFTVGGGRLLVFTGIKRLGLISYSAYLLHWFAVSFALQIGAPLEIEGWARFLVLLPLVVLITAIASQITHHFIELNGIQIGQRLVARLSAFA